MNINENSILYFNDIMDKNKNRLHKLNKIY